jgi:hypothetical protein
VQLTSAVTQSLAYVNEVGASVVYPGTHYLDVSNGNGQNVTITVVVPESAASVLHRPVPK